MLRNRFKISSFLKKRSKQKYVFIASVICLLTLLRVALFLQNCLSAYVLPATIEYRFDPLYSITLQERFIQATKEQLLLLHDSFTRERCIENLKKAFPYLSALHGEYTSRDSLRIKISGSSPRIIVNNHEVILDDGSWSSIDNFKSTAIEDLIQVIVKKRESHELATYLLKISAAVSPGFFKQYTMIYLDYYDILLQPKNSLCNYLLHVTADFFFTTIRQEYLTWADKGHVTTEKNYEHSEGTQVMYDMRFKDRIYRKIDTMV